MTPLNALRALRIYYHQRHQALNQAGKTGALSPERIHEESRRLTALLRCAEQVVAGNECPELPESLPYDADDLATFARTQIARCYATGASHEAQALEAACELLGFETLAAGDAAPGPADAPPAPGLSEPSQVEKQ